VGDALTTRPRPTPGERHSHNLPEANLGWRHSHGLPEANPRQSAHFRLAREHLGRCSGRCPTPPTSARPRARDVVTTRPRPPRAREAVTTRSRPTLGGRRGHDSPEASPGQEMQSRLARGQLQMGDAVMTRRRPTRAGDGHDSLKTNPGRETQSQLARDQPRAKTQ
jgi:hypothetical protein